MDTTKLVEVLRKTGAIKFGEFELSHGGTSNYYVDKYVFETDPGALKSIASAFAEELDNETLAGVALGAIPLVTATALAANLPYVIVRKRSKEYGTGNRIEGTIPAEGEVVVIEDIATTGQSAIDAVKALRDAGAHVERVLVVVDREEGATEAMAKHDLALQSLTTASDLLSATDSAE